MEDYLQDCEVVSIELKIPARHGQRLLDHFDGRHAGERAVATAYLRGPELSFEAGGARLVLGLQSGQYVAQELEIVDDRNGAFFAQVVVNLLLAYKGSMRCQLRWSRPRDGKRQQQVVVEPDHSSFAPGVEPGRWLAGEAAPRPAETALARQLPANDEGMPDPQTVEEAIAKLQEGERYWAEYQRLKVRNR